MRESTPVHKQEGGAERRGEAGFLLIRKLDAGLDSRSPDHNLS